jgi:hypothetical protein
MLRVIIKLLSFLRYHREMNEARLQGPTCAKSGVSNLRPRRARFEDMGIAFQNLSQRNRVYEALIAEANSST